jgi:hypothetical protein
MNDATLDKMRRMKLLGMYRAFKTNLETERSETFTSDEIIAHLSMPNGMKDNTGMWNLKSKTPVSVTRQTWKT